MRFKYYLRGAGIGVIAATLILSVAFLLHDNISDEEVIRRAMKLGMVMQENTPGTLADIQQSGTSSVDLETGTDPEDGAKADSDPLTDPDAANPDDMNPDATNPDGTDPSNQADPSNQTDPSDGTDQPSDPDMSQPSDSDTQGNASQPSNDQANHTGQPTGSEADENTDKPSKNKTSDDKKDETKDTASDDKPKKQSDEVEIVIESGDVSRMVSAKVFEAGLVDDADEFNSYLGAHDYDNMLQPGAYKIKKGSSFRQIAKILTRQ